VCYGVRHPFTQSSFQSFIIHLASELPNLQDVYIRQHNDLALDTFANHCVTTFEEAILDFNPTSLNRPAHLAFRIHFNSLIFSVMSLPQSRPLGLSSEEDSKADSISKLVLVSHNKAAESPPMNPTPHFSRASIMPMPGWHMQRLRSNRGGLLNRLRRMW
jgi:hypothetical protein